MPTVSIIVPFNQDGEKYLENCIKSIQKQTYKDYEIILINDSSKICKPNLSPIVNIGVGKARNEGIEKANGKYIMFVDVDDYIDENLLSNLQTYIKQDIDVIKYKMKVIKREYEQEILGPVFSCTNGEDAFNKLCFEDKYLDSPCLYLIRKEYLQKTGLKFPENMYHEDFGLIPLLIVGTKKVVSTDIVGYMYMQTEDSIMRNNDYQKTVTRVCNKFEHYLNMVKMLEKMDISKRTKENVKIYYTNSVILSLKELKKEDRRFFENKIRKMKMIDNLKVHNLKQFIKRCILEFSIEAYLKLQK